VLTADAPALVLQKNVYSVFRYDPPSVGFAQLSGIANKSAVGDVPSPTIGSPGASFTAGSSASARAPPLSHAILTVAAAAGGAVLMGLAL
jgi:cathepsin D